MIEPLNILTDSDLARRRRNWMLVVLFSCLVSGFLGFHYGEWMTMRTYPNLCPDVKKSSLNHITYAGSEMTCYYGDYGFKREKVVVPYSWSRKTTG